MKISLGDFDARVGRKDILKPTMEMKVYTKLVMRKEFEQKIVSYLKI
jgi:hypothetical protein